MAHVAAVLVVAGVALYVAAPLFAARGAAAEAWGRDLELERLIHERSLAVQALRELQFDREMNKLSENDFRTLRAPLEKRALGAMAAIERLREERKAQVPKPAAQAPPPPSVEPAQRRLRRVTFCPQCGVRIRSDASFCVECGASLNPIRSLAAPPQ